MAKHPDPRAIDDPTCIEILANPVRQEIVDTLWALGGKATVAALAEELGRPADGLYYHLGMLCGVGLVIEIKATEGEERRFQLAGKRKRGPLRLAYRLGEQGNADALSTYVRGMLSIAERDFGQALASPTTLASGRRRELWAARNKGWVTAEAQEQIVQLLERLCDLTSRPRQSERDRLLTFAFVMAPAVRQPKRRIPKRMRP
jgi:DNA-binding transcriptional ArsR family regulator